MYRCLSLVLFVACHSASHGARDGAVADDRDASGIDAARATDAAIDAPGEAGDVVDAAIDAATPMSDAGYAGSDAGTPGIVACYSEGAPNATCTLPTHCCFTAYSAQHNGACTNATCAWGTISCDGPEDCAAGQRCCAHAIKDLADETIGYSLACQTAACGAAPANEELCHPGTCSSGMCVNALGANNDLPRALSICR